MLPLSPIISSIITFLETQSIASAGGVISILQTIDKHVSRPASPQLQLLVFAYILPLIAITFFIFPFSSINPVFLISLSLFGGFSFSRLLSGCWWPFAAFCATAIAYTVAVASMKKKKKEEKEDARLLAKDMRDFYMTGICEDGRNSCKQIEDRLEAFLAFGERGIANTIATFLLSCLCAATALVAWLAFGRKEIAATMALLAFLFLAFGLLTATSKIAPRLLSATLRASIVILEALYMPCAETATKVLRPLSYCPGACTTGSNPLLMGNATAFACTDCNAGWRLSPSGFPGVDYMSSIVKAFLPFLAFVLLVYAIGLPFLEWRISDRCVGIVLASGTSGATPDDVYAESLSCLRTPAIYTFFLYRRQFARWLPALVLLSKLLPAIIGQLQEALGVFFLLPPFFILNIVLLAAIRPYHSLPCLFLGMAMHACNTVSSLLPLFSGSVPRVVDILLKVVSSCAPIAGWVVVFVVLCVRRRRRGKREEIEVDDVVEDGEVVRERMANLYKSVDNIIAKEVISLLVVYGCLFATAGAVASGYYFGFFYLINH